MPTANEPYVTEDDEWCCEDCAKESHLAWCNWCVDEELWHMTWCEDCRDYH